MDEGLLFRQIRWTALQILVLLLLLTCQHNPLRTTSSLKDLCQPALSFLLFYQLFMFYSYYFKNGQPFSNTLFQPNPVHTSTSHFLTIHRNSYLSPCVNYVDPLLHYLPIYAWFYTVDFFPPVSTPKSRTCFSLSHTRYMTNPFHSSRFFNPTIFGEEYISLIFSLCSFPLPSYRLPIRPKYSLQHSIFKHPLTYVPPSTLSFKPYKNCCFITKSTARSRRFTKCKAITQCGDWPRVS